MSLSKKLLTWHYEDRNDEESQLMRTLGRVGPRPFPILTMTSKGQILFKVRALYFSKL